jgi:hypothetical protein
MKSKERIYFAKDPEKFVQQAIAKFVEESSSNQRRVDGGRYFDSPLVGFASANDPLFKQYKKIIGRFHFSPQDIFDLTFGKSDRKKELSVISWILPISEDTRKGNRKEDKYPSLLWSHTRYFGEPFNVKLRKHVVSLLKRRGYKAVAPTNSPHLRRVYHAKGKGDASWHCGYRPCPKAFRQTLSSSPRQLSLLLQ